MACNKEVLEDRAKEDQQSAREKEIDYANMTVSWRPEVYDFYRRRPERFAADHPDLKLGADRRIGKAVTFFVERSLFDLLPAIPPEQRTADLRLMTTAEDVALAILASVSEPTYFDPVAETQPSKLLAGAVPGTSAMCGRGPTTAATSCPFPPRTCAACCPASACWERGGGTCR